ncbi:helix-turn-helix domain-containing protein [Streptomyces sp. NBC_01314]|uniref:helix-turn-helix domain-containing protein n=1 Tax=Streptomyces sp. NBC_01314 TaxID=2903821 RepID=UPI003090877B|nr:helix-turn-helix transcriptional regulator [Streptomyces sp. NBC_01314]
MTRLRAARLAAGLSLSQVATAVGCTRSMLSLVERGQANLSQRKLATYLRTVGLDDVADVIDTSQLIPA